MTTETRKRRSYTEDFKRDAVSLVTAQGYKISEAAPSVDIGANLPGRWHRRFEGEASGARLSVDEREELKRLRTENRMLRMEKEISKKASQFFATEMTDAPAQPIHVSSLCRSLIADYSRVTHPLSGPHCSVDFRKLEKGCLLQTGKREA